MNRMYPIIPGMLADMCSGAWTHYYATTDWTACDPGGLARIPWAPPLPATSPYTYNCPPLHLSFIGVDIPFFLFEELWVFTLS